MERIKSFLKDRVREGTLRSLKPASSRHDGLISFKKNEYLDFSSNDYLSISNHPEIVHASNKACERFGTGAGASRLLSGDFDIHHELEEKIAHFKGKKAALIFNSGYQANVGIISALFSRGDVIFSDKLNHASIIDGMVLSGARFFRFKHNDLKHLESLLKIHRKKYKNSLIITETIFSMDGDRPDLKAIAALKKKYNSNLMVDEAHATGIFGKSGSGLVEEENLTDSVDIIMGTFSKALGSFGAYMASSQEIKDYLVTTCRSFIYSTALPAGVIAANIKSLELIKNEPNRRKLLLENADYFRNELKSLGLNVKGSSQIIPLIVGDSLEAVMLSRKLEEKKYRVLPIRPPTVPQGEARLRFSLNFSHTKEKLRRLCHDIKEIYGI